MNEIVTKDYIFNKGFYSKYNNITLNHLLRYSISIGELDNEKKDLIISNYKDQMFNYIFSILDFDDELIDYNLYIEENIKKIFDMIDEILDYEFNPFDALKYIIDNKPYIVIDDSIKKYNDKLKYLTDLVQKIKKENKFLCKLSKPLNEYVSCLENYLKNNKEEYENFCSYSLMSSISIYNISTLKDFDKNINSLLIELSIINKFSEEELKLLISNMYIVDNIKEEDIDIEYMKEFLLDYERKEDGYDDLRSEIIEQKSFNNSLVNICSQVLYNYIFNFFYKESDSILGTNDMQNIIKNDISANLYSVEDVIDIIENGKIKFSPEEKEYIYKYFIPQFKIEVIEYKNKNVFAKTKELI